MRAVVLMDNVSNNPALTAQWGLSIYIEYQGRRYLLDAGAGPEFAENAKVLGIDLAQVDCGILSHAHHDHADGMDTFFQENADAPFYLREPSGENCYGCKDDFLEYIGIKKGLLETYQNRLRRTGNKTELAPGVYLLGHTTPELDCCGQMHQQFLKIADQFMYDDFRHEQSLIFDTDQGLVIFNSCCHAGADVVIQEARDAFPGRKVHAIVGGFHLFAMPADQVRAFARRLEETGVEHVVTGHCTGQDAFEILRETLGDRVRQMEVGLEMEF